jgi:hypothetical protein
MDLFVVTLLRARARIMGLFLNHDLFSYCMVESIINHWTVYHFLFGLGTAFIISYIIKTRNPISSISLFILILWEIFEFRKNPHYWTINYLNNIMDIVVGLIAVFFGFKIIDILTRYLGHNNEGII